MATEKHIISCSGRWHEDLTEAVAAAQDGDTLVLHGDVLLHRTLVLDKAVTLTTDGQQRTVRAEHTGAAVTVTASCRLLGASQEAPLVVDGGGLCRDGALVELHGEDIYFQYVTVCGGCNSGLGGGIYGGADCRARMEYCVICRNCAAVGGAGFVECGGDLKIHRSTIAHNRAAEKGGAFRLRGKMLPTGCDIFDNTAGAPRGMERRLAQLPAFAGELVATVDGDGTELAVWRSTESETYDSYAAKLTAAGFAQLRQTQIDTARYATFQNEAFTLTLMDTPALNRTVRLAIDDGAAPELDGGCGEVSVQPRLVQLGTGCATMQNGASLLFRLADGRLLVIDGGYTDDAEDLHRTMLRLSGGAPLRIAAWVLTHAHGDHMEAFLAFWHGSWARDAVLERLVVHLPGDEIFWQNMVGGVGDTGWRQRLQSCVAEITPAPQVIRAHPGQQLRLGGAELTVLYTAELAAPEEIWSFNDTSLACRLHLAGTDFLLLGDCSVTGGNTLTALYPAALRCHVLQASHHGHYNNAPAPLLYETVAARHTLWCSTWERYQWSENRNAPANRWLFEREQQGEMTIWCAGGMVRTFAVTDGALLPLEIAPRLRDTVQKEEERMDIRLVGLDLDGTVLDDDRKVRQRTIDALRLAADKGVNLAVISGRNFLAVPEEIRQLPFIRYFVLCNGAGIYDKWNDELLFQADIPLEEALALYDAMDEEEVYYDCYLSDGAWTPRSHYEAIDEFVPVESHRAFLKVNRQPFDDFRAALRRRGKSVWKVQSIYKDTVTRDREMARLQEKFPQYTFVTAYPYNLEVNMPAATKGQGLMQLAEILQLQPAQVMAFGDGGNDVTMLQSAGVGVAMGNACDEAKAAAACVGPTNNEDGVAQVLEALVCGEEQVRQVCIFKE